MSFIDNLAAANRVIRNTFGEAATYTPLTGSPFALKVLREARPTPEEVSNGVWLVVWVIASDLAAPPVRGDQVMLGTTTFKVHQIEADEEAGLGIRLGLHK